MDDQNLALTHEEALEIFAYLLTSAQKCVEEPPDYGVYRLVSAADRMARMWAPRTTDELAAYLTDLGTQMPSEAARIDVDLEGFLTYLGSQIGALAKIVVQLGATEETSDES
jgi:hypothetical protein